MPRLVTLLLVMLLVGCGGTTRGIRPGTSQEKLRYTGRGANTPMHYGEPDVMRAAPMSVAMATGLPATPGESPPPMPLRGISGEGLGNGIPRALLRLVPEGATTAAQAGPVAATGEAIVGGGAVFAAGGSVVLVCLTVKTAMDGVETPIDIADTFFGTHFGDIHGWVQGCYAPKNTAAIETPARTAGMRPASEPRSTPSSLPAPEAGRDKDERSSGRIYATYTKFNTKTNRSYSGRTSMVIDLRKPLRPQAERAIGLRNSNHHVDEDDEPEAPAFREAVLDEFDAGTAVNYADRYNDVAYWRIRGREQQLIDFFGSARADTGEPYRTENVKRGVAKDNPLGRLFHDAATKKWGQLHPYTGD